MDNDLNSTCYIFVTQFRFVFFVVKFSFADRMSANPRVGGFALRKRIIGSFRRKRSPIDYFANFADFA